MAPSWTNVITRAQDTQHNLWVISNPTHTLWLTHYSADFKEVFDETTQLVLRMCLDAFVTSDRIRMMESSTVDLLEHMTAAIKPMGDALLTLNRERSKALPFIKDYIQNTIQVIDDEKILQSKIRLNLAMHNPADFIQSNRYFCGPVMHVYVDKMRILQILNALITTKSQIYVEMTQIDAEKYPKHNEPMYHLTFNINSVPCTVSRVIEKLIWLLEGTLDILKHNDHYRAQLSFVVYTMPPTKYSTNSLRLIKNKKVLILGDRRDVMHAILSKFGLTLSVSENVESAKNQFEIDFDGYIGPPGLSIPRVKIEDLPGVEDDAFKVMLVRQLIAILT